MNRAYARFGHWLEHSAPATQVPAFRDVCREIRVPPADLDEVLFRETGLHGDEILDIYFGNGRKKH